jgi:hypothetical protein
LIEDLIPNLVIGNVNNMLIAYTMLPTPNYKIISKVLVDRVAEIMPYFVSAGQKGFIKGRHIGDWIYMTSKAINILLN